MAQTSLPIPLGVYTAQHNALSNDTNLSNTAGLPSESPTLPFWRTEELGTGYPTSSEGSQGDLPNDVDICIIGSGITGVSTAYHLAKLFAKQAPSSKPIKAVILDARDFCNGATGRNGGHLTATGQYGFTFREAKYGRDDALREILLQDYTVAETVQLIKESHLEEAVDLVSGGFVALFFTKEEENEAKADILGAANAGIDISNIEWLTKEQVEKEYGAAYSGVRLPGNNLWPRKLVGAIYSLAQQATPNFELSVHTFTPVTSVSPAPGAEGRRWAVSTPRGVINSSYVLHATNAYVPYLLPHLHGPAGVIPGRGQIIATRAAVDLPKTAFAANEGFEYWFPRPVKNPSEKPLVILGGGREIAAKYELYETDDSKVNEEISQAMRKFLPAVYPSKFEEGREPEMEWSGIMGFTKSGDPFVGPVIDPDDDTKKKFKNQYICAGFSGHGMPRAFACAEAVAGIIASDIAGQRWTPPVWIPLHYLTQKY